MTYFFNNEETNPKFWNDVIISYRHCTTKAIVFGVVSMATDNNYTIKSATCFVVNSNLPTISFSVALSFSIDDKSSYELLDDMFFHI